MIKVFVREVVSDGASAADAEDDDVFDDDVDDDDSAAETMEAAEATEARVSQRMAMKTME